MPLYDKPDSEPRLTPEEQAVLDAAKAWALKERWYQTEPPTKDGDLFQAVCALRASQQPKFCEHCGQELPK